VVARAAELVETGAAACDGPPAESEAWRHVGPSPKRCRLPPLGALTLPVVDHRQPCRSGTGYRAGDWQTPRSRTTD